MRTAYLALGSNLGDRTDYLAQAVRALNAVKGVRVAKVSSIYETVPVGNTDQPDFLNMAVELETELTPEVLLANCLAVEKLLGRVRQERWGPRTIDVDFLLMMGMVVDSKNLTLPHPRLAERAFVLVPLAEIAPDLMVEGEPVRKRAMRCDLTGLRCVGLLNWLPIAK